MRSVARGNEISIESDNWTKLSVADWIEAGITSYSNCDLCLRIDGYILLKLNCNFDCRLIVYSSMVISSWIIASTEFWLFCNWLHWSQQCFCLQRFK